MNAEGDNSLKCELTFPLSVVQSFTIARKKKGTVWDGVTSSLKHKVELMRHKTYPSKRTEAIFYYSLI